MPDLEDATVQLQKLATNVVSSIMGTGPRKKPKKVLGSPLYNAPSLEGTGPKEYAPTPRQKTPSLLSPQPVQDVGPKEYTPTEGPAPNLLQSSAARGQRDQQWRNTPDETGVTPDQQESSRVEDLRQTPGTFENLMTQLDSSMGYPAYGSGLSGNDAKRRSMAKSLLWSLTHYDDGSLVEPDRQNKALLYVQTQASGGPELLGKKLAQQKASFEQGIVEHQALQERIAKESNLVEDPGIAGQMKVALGAMSGWVRQLPLEVAARQFGEQYGVDPNDVYAEASQNPSVQTALNAWSLATMAVNPGLGAAQLGTTVASTGLSAVQDGSIKPIVDFGKGLVESVDPRMLFDPNVSLGDKIIHGAGMALAGLGALHVGKALRGKKGAVAPEQAAPIERETSTGVKSAPEPTSQDQALNDMLASQANADEAPVLQREQTTAVAPQAHTKAYHPGEEKEVFDMKPHVVSLDSLIASHHHENFAENLDYPSELQPRDRSRAGMKQQVQKMSQNVDERMLADRQSTAEGTPIIGPDDVVESGNGRVMALRTARDAGNQAWQDYQAMLKEQYPGAEGIKDPVLVRSRETQLTPEQRLEFVKKANGGGTAAMGAAERAMGDAGSISPEFWNSLEPVGNSFEQTMKAKKNQSLLAKFLQQVPSNEHNGLLTPDGKLNADGMLRLKRMAATDLLGPEAKNTIETLFEGEPTSANIANGFYRSMPDLLKAKSPELSSIINGALEEFDRYKNSGLSADEYRAQGKMIQLDPQVQELFDNLMDAAGRNGSAKKVAAVFADLGEKAATLKKYASQDDLFGMGAPTLADIPGATEATAGSGNTFITDEMYAQAKKDVMSPQVNFGPFGQLGAAAKIAAYHIERGIRHIPDLIQKIRDEMPNLKLSDDGLRKAIDKAFKQVDNFHEGTRTAAQVAAAAFLPPKEFASKVGGIMGRGIEKVIAATADYKLNRDRAQVFLDTELNKALGTKNWATDKASAAKLETLAQKINDKAAGGLTGNVEFTPEEQTLMSNVGAFMKGIADRAWKAGVGVRDVFDKLNDDLIGMELRAKGRLVDEADVTQPEIGGPTKELKVKDHSWVKGKVLGFTKDGQMRLQVESGDVYLVPKGADVVRPIIQMGELFVPRVLKQGYMNALKKAVAEGNTEWLQAQAERMMQHGGQWGDTSEAMAFLERIGTELRGQKDVASYMSNLEKPRVNLFPLEAYEPNYGKAMTKYVDGAYKRISIAETFGTGDPQVLEYLLNGLSDRKMGGSLADSNYVRTLIYNGLRIGQDAHYGRKFSAAEGMYQFVTKLSALTTPLAQLSDLVAVAARVETKSLWKAGIDMLDKDKRLENAMLSGAYHSAFRDLEVRDLGNKAARIADILHTARGVKFMDRTVKEFTMAAAFRDVESILSKEQVSASDMRKLERYDATGALKDPNWRTNEGTVNKIAAAVQRDLMYSGDSMHTPQWMASPIGTVATRFKRPAYWASRFVIHDVMSELAKGNVKPALKLAAFGAVTGEGIGTLKAMFTGRERKSIIDEITSDKGTWDKFTAIMFHSLGSLIDAGTLGYVQDITNPAVLHKGQQPSVQKILAPVLTGDLQAILETSPVKLKNEKGQVTFSLTKEFKDLLNGRPGAYKDRVLKSAGKMVPDVKRAGTIATKIKKKLKKDDLGDLQ